ncbi:MAG: hypothetical protein JRG86_22020 [Deltaproteobacteria bacterium]|nr:hypothetical protein [Deltaproteobacteria bacterium]MBW2498140.1 hypothetical protein [Deltaproteobacteria bacterium]
MVEIRYAARAARLEESEAARAHRRPAATREYEKGRDGRRGAPVLSMLADSNPDDMIENRPPAVGGPEGEDSPGVVP